MLGSWSLSPYFAVGFNWVHTSHLLAPLQAGPSGTAGGCAWTGPAASKPKANGFACLQTPLWGWGAGRGRGAQLVFFLAFLKPKFFAIPTSPALLLVFPFLWVFALCGEQVFLCGSHFFCTGVSWVFQGVVGACLGFLSSTMQAAVGRHHLLGWQRAAPQLLGSRVGKTSKGEEAQFLSMAQRAGIYMYWWEVAGLLLRREWAQRGHGKGHFWQVWKIPNKPFCF